MSYARKLIDKKKQKPKTITKADKEFKRKKSKLKEQEDEYQRD